MYLARNMDFKELLSLVAFKKYLKQNTNVCFINYNKNQVFELEHVFSFFL